MMVDWAELCMQQPSLDDNYDALKLWASVSSRVHICAMKYWQLITTYVCANWSE